MDGECTGSQRSEAKSRKPVLYRADKGGSGTGSEVRGRQSEVDGRRFAEEGIVAPREHPVGVKTIQRIQHLEQTPDHATVGVSQEHVQPVKNASEVPQDVAEHTCGTANGVDFNGGELSQQKMYPAF